MPDMSHSSYMFTGFEANCNRNWVRRHLRGCDLTTTSHLCAVHLVRAGMCECLTLSSWHPKASEDLEFRGWRKVNKDLSKFRFARESPLTADCLEGIRPWDLANSSIGPIASAVTCSTSLCGELDLSGSTYYDEPRILAGRKHGMLKAREGGTLFV